MTSFNFIHAFVFCLVRHYYVYLEQCRDRSIYWRDDYVQSHSPEPIIRSTWPLSPLSSSIQW